MPENDTGLEHAPADIPTASAVIEQMIASTAQHLAGNDDDTFLELLKAHILVLDGHDLDAAKMLAELKDLADRCASDQMEPEDGDH